MNRKIIKGFLSLVVALTIIFSNVAPALASTNGNCNFSGYVGVSAVRDLSGSPLTLTETLTGNYYLEYDFITYNEARAIVASFANYNYFQTLIESLGINAATAAICAYMGWGAVAGVVIGTAMSLGYAVLTTLNKNGFTTAYNTMSSSDLLKVSYYSTNTGLQRFYGKYTPLSYSSGTDGYNTYSIKNPGSPTYYDWYAGVIGYLYNIGV